jgi:hypothetical protein
MCIPSQPLTDAAGAMREALVPGFQMSRCEHGFHVLPRSVVPIVGYSRIDDMSCSTIYCLFLPYIIFHLFAAWRICTPNISVRAKVWYARFGTKGGW